MVDLDRGIPSGAISSSNEARAGRKGFFGKLKSRSYFTVKLFMIVKS